MDSFKRVLGRSMAVTTSEGHQLEGLLFAVDPLSRCLVLVVTPPKKKDSSSHASRKNSRNSRKNGRNKNKNKDGGLGGAEEEDNDNEDDNDNNDDDDDDDDDDEEEDEEEEEATTSTKRRTQTGTWLRAEDFLVVAVEAVAEWRPLAETIYPIRAFRRPRRTAGRRKASELGVPALMTPSIHAGLRMFEQAQKAKMEKALRQFGQNVTAEAQLIFSALAKTQECSWRGDQIVIDIVCIKPPYTTADVSLLSSKPPNAMELLERIRKVLGEERKRLGIH